MSVRRTTHATPLLIWRAQAIIRTLRALRRLMPLSHILLLDGRLNSTHHEYRPPTPAGTIRGHQLPTGTIIITEDEPTATAPTRVAIYARVSAAENTPNLDTQADRLVSYCAAKGYQVHVIIKEIGSAVNDSRAKFLKLLADSTITHIVVEHKDRATRFGFRYIETLLQQ